MAKLSTATLRVMIEGWLSTPKIREDLRHHSDSPEEEEQLWKLWCDGSQWKRCEKHTLKDEAEDRFGMTKYIGEWKPGLPGNQQERQRLPYFDTDAAGEANMELVTKYFNDPKAGAKCVFRMFVPNNDFADNYRLEVITTPEDDVVVGWTLVVD